MRYRLWLTVLGLLALTTAVRAALVAWDPSRLDRDPDSYLALARQLAATGTFGFQASQPDDTSTALPLPVTPTARRPPLYPLLLAPFFRLGFQPVLHVHLLLSAAITLLTWQVARQWKLGPWATLAAAFVALDPLLVYWGIVPMSETLSATLFALALLLLSGSDRSPSSLYSWLAGAVLGLAMLCRPTMWAYALIAVPAGASSPGWQEPFRIRVQWTVVVLAVALGVQVPWAIRNWLVFGRPIFTTTHGGYTLLLGNNTVFYDEVVNGPAGATWQGESLRRWQLLLQQRAQEAGAHTEVAYDAFCYELAWQTIRSRPSDFLQSIALRVTNFWRPFPHETESYSTLVRIACAAFYVAQFLLLAAALIRRDTWQWPWMLVPVALLSFTLVHALYWSNMRMRTPLTPGIALASARGAQLLFFSQFRRAGYTKG